MNQNYLRCLFLGLTLFLSTGLAAFAQGTALGTQLDAVVRLPGNVLVGVSPTGALLRSVDNGVNFTQVRAADTPRALLTLALSNSVLIAAGDAGNFVRSTDGGVTWSTLQAATNPSFVGKILSLAGDGGSDWVAVGTGTTNNKITPIYSTNSGLTWQSSPTIDSPVGELRGVVWSGEQWVAVGGNSFGGFALRTANPASAWSLVTVPALVAPLNAVSSTGGGLILAVGDAGTVLYSGNHGETFTDVGGGVVSDDLLSVIYVSGNIWAAGGDQGVVIQFDSIASEPVSVTQAPFAEGTPVNALVAGSTLGSYFFATPATAAPVVHNISASVSVVSNQLRVQLQGALTGFSYYVQHSSTLASWSAVPGSTQTFGGVSALFWDYPLPLAGEKVFYRVVLGSTP